MALAWAEALKLAGRCAEAAKLPGVSLDRTVIRGRIAQPPTTQEILQAHADARLQVIAQANDGSLAPAITSLPLEPTLCLTYLTVDRPLYRPGETILFRSLTLERHSLRGDLDVPIRIELRDPSGAVVPNAVRDGVTQRGVSNGAFVLPASAVGGEYTLSVSSLDGFFPAERRTIQVQQYRVYFAARNPLGKPIHVAGQVLDQQGREIAGVETMRDGLGSFRFVPSRGERYVLKVDRPVDVTNAPELPVVASGLPVLDTGRGVFAANESIAFNVRIESALPVLGQAACRGATVGEGQFTLRPGDNSLTLPITANVGGVIRLTVSNTLTIPATPLVERLVFRQHDAKL